MRPGRRSPKFESAPGSQRIGPCLNGGGRVSFQVSMLGVDGLMQP